MTNEQTSFNTNHNTQSILCC